MSWKTRKLTLVEWYDLAVFWSYASPHKSLFSLFFDWMIAFQLVCFSLGSIDFKLFLISFRSNEYESAHLALLRTYQNSFSRYVIPCFVAPGKCTEPNTLSCRWEWRSEHFRFIFHCCFWIPKTFDCLEDLRDALFICDATQLLFTHSDFYSGDSNEDATKLLVQYANIIACHMRFGIFRYRPVKKNVKWPNSRLCLENVNARHLYLNMCYM